MMMWTLVRVRRSRGSGDRQTAQSQAIMGTPWDVPVPRKITSIVDTSLCRQDVERHGGEADAVDRHLDRVFTELRQHELRER